MASRSNNPIFAQGCGALGLVALVIIAGINLAHVVRRVPAPPHFVSAPADAVMRSEQRFARVRDALKTRHVRGTVGYVADVPPERMRADAAAMEELFLAQFALVPVVLEANGAAGRWAIANLHRAAAAERIPRGFHVVEDCGDGVLLLEREAP